MSHDHPNEDWASAAETRVLSEAIRLAAGRPWDQGLFEAAVSAAGLAPAEGALLLPDGPRDLAALLYRRHDAEALAHLESVDPFSLRVRERIVRAVSVRIEAGMRDEPAVRRAVRFLAAPLNGPLALRLGWSTADQLWRWAGDEAADENHYTKRVILGGVLLSTLAVRLNGDAAAAERHLRARVDQVMAFEKWKARLPDVEAGLRRTAAHLARLRYGVRASDAGLTVDADAHPHPVAQPDSGVS
jgi:ubiquinone biosynthesis protein COQ9